MIGMFRRKTHIKLLTAFVIAFICLNAGGSVCVAYCQSFEQQMPMSEHCRMAAQHSGGDADPKTKITVTAAGRVACCSVAVNFITGPVESLHFDANTSILSLPQDPLRFANEPVVEHLSRPIPIYRGPPPIDRRPDRLKHRVIRI